MKNSNPNIANANPTENPNPFMDPEEIQQQQNKQQASIFAMYDKSAIRTYGNFMKKFKNYAKGREFESHKQRIFDRIEDTAESYYTFSFFSAVIGVLLYLVWLVFVFITSGKGSRSMKDGIQTEDIILKLFGFPIIIFGSFFDIFITPLIIRIITRGYFFFTFFYLILVFLIC